MEDTTEQSILAVASALNIKAHVWQDIVCSACGKAIDDPELLDEAQKIFC